jgi:hypothetical protein
MRSLLSADKIKRMRQILLTLILSFFLQSLFSQGDSLLKKFKFRNINYRAITIDIGGAGQFSSTDFVSGRSKNHGSSGSAGTSYYQVKSTDRVLLNMSGGIYGGFSSARSDNNTNDYRYKSFSLAPQFSLLNKWFSRKLFTELGTDLSVGFYTAKNTDKTLASAQKTDRDRQSLAITAGIGKGRLENITDMQNALWLSKALEKEGRLSRSLSAEELNGLGRAVTAANNTRVLDARKRTQFILEAIDDYFQQKGLISKTDIKYFSNLNDIVFFAINDPRLSGTETFIRLTPAITHSRENFSQKPSQLENKENATTKSTRLSAGLNKYVPVSLRHQNNYGIAAALNYISNHYNDKYFNSGVLISETDLDPILRQVGIDLFFEHAIYPNTRTVVSFKFDSRTGYQEMEQETSFFSASNLAASCSYFISYRTRFNCNLGVTYQSNIYAIDKYLSLRPETR